MHVPIRRLGVDARAVAVFLHLSSFGHRATYSRMKPAAPGPLDEPRNVPYRVTYLRRLHAPSELIEDLLGDLLAQARRAAAQEHVAALPTRFLESKDHDDH